MKLIPHLTFDGNCKEAFEFYRDLMSGSLTMTTFGESPAADHVPKEWKDRIVHATLTLDESEIAGADVSPDEYKKAEGFFLLLEPGDTILHSMPPSMVLLVFNYRLNTDAYRWALSLYKW